MSADNRTALYNPQISPPFVNILNDNEKTPSLNFSNASETKLTPIGHSPKNFEASQVESLNQELAVDSPSATECAL